MSKKLETLNLAKLEKLRSKFENGDQAKLADVKKQLETVTLWYADFRKDCPLTEGELKKELKSSPRKVLDKVCKLIESKDSLRLEVTDTEKKQLDRARKWAQMVVDCAIVMKDKTQTTVDFDRIYDLKGEIERLRCLDNDIDCIRSIRAEFVIIDQWHKELDTVTEID